MNAKIGELLYRSLDDRLSLREKRQLEQALQNSKELRAEKKRLTTLRLSIKNSAQQSFKPFFTERVMSQIFHIKETESNQEAFFASLISIFRPLAIGIAVLLIIIISYNMKQTDRISLSGALATPELSLEDAFDPTLSLVMELSK